MPPLLTGSQKTASALRRTERALRTWLDESDSPRGDIDKMLGLVGELRAWVQGHVLHDIEKALDHKTREGDPGAHQPDERD